MNKNTHINMKRIFTSIVLVQCLIFLFSSFSLAVDTEETKKPLVKFSKETHRCLGCHANVTSGIVHDWKTSLHSRTTPYQGLNKTELEKRISAKSVDDGLLNVAVGCYECHSLNKDKHSDNFAHFGINIIAIDSINGSRIITC